MLFCNSQVGGFLLQFVLLCLVKDWNSFSHFYIALLEFTKLKLYSLTFCANHKGWEIEVPTTRKLHKFVELHWSLQKLLFWGYDLALIKKILYLSFLSQLTNTQLLSKHCEDIPESVPVQCPTKVRHSGLMCRHSGELNFPYWGYSRVPLLRLNAVFQRTWN